VTLILRVIDSLEGASTLSDANIDLCYGHLELGDCEAARKYGEKGLELAAEPRQIRNAHYLLGEVAYKMGDLDTAHFHFDELARYYPQFRNLKSVLFAIDLRSMVNFRL
jgi:TolA-binding protein